VDATECNADILVIATTRPQGYSDDFSPKFYEHKWLAPLSKQRALHYAQRLVDVRYAGEEDRKEKIIGRLARACRQDATSRLMRSPLQVTIMATLVDRVGQPPQERWNLFKDYYTVIYEREMERDTPPAKILREYQADVNAIHARVGLFLQVESEKTGKTDARLPLDRFKRIVTARLTEEGYSGKSLQGLQESIMTAAMHRLVFLVGLEQKQIGFEVRSLQEFMAAEGLMHGPEEDIPSRLRKIAPISHWRNVFLFAAGKCFAERQHLRDTVHTICLQLNEDSDLAVQRVLAGSQLAVDLLEDGPARKQPKYSASLLRVAFRLLDLPPTSYQTKIAGLYSAEFEEIFTQEITQRLSQTHRTRQMGAWNLLSALSSRLSFARKIRDAHWPMDNKEGVALVRYAGNVRDMLQKLRPAAPHVPPAALEEALEYLLPLEAQEVVAITKTKGQEWFRAVLLTLSQIRYGYNRPEIALRFPDTRTDQVFRMDFGCFTEGQGNWLMPMGQIPSADPGWGLHIAVGRFLSNPSKSELASQLRYLSKLAGGPDAWTVGAWWVPWALSASIEGRSPTELSRLAGQVDAGALGDTREWAAAEHRWLTAGVGLKDLLYSPNADLPFGPDIAEVGLPYRDLRRGWFMPRPLDLQRMIPHIEGLDRSPIRSTLSERLLIAAGTASDYYDIDKDDIPSPATVVSIPPPRVCPKHPRVEHGISQSYRGRVGRDIGPAGTRCILVRWPSAPRPSASARALEAVHS
jgi:hypothetical protein